MIIPPLSTIGSADSYLYTYACHEDEAPLCRLELNALFGEKLMGNCFLSPVYMDPSRSPFIKQQIAVAFTGGSLAEIADRAAAVKLVPGQTFKVVYVETDASMDFEQQRAVERQVGFAIRGKAEMRSPDRIFGIARLNGLWLFGEWRKNQAVWLKHNRKPQHYSTALGTRMARAVVNIAVPSPEGRKAIDPCCGIGTVLIEALSMGIDMIGYDINPHAIRGARSNLAHFGFPDVVALHDMRSLTGSYDAAVLDFPYNVCSVLSSSEQLSMLESARRLARKAVFISTETIDPLLESAGFTITDRCLVKKGAFSRHVLVCR